MRDVLLGWADGNRVSSERFAEDLGRLLHLYEHAALREIRLATLLSEIAAILRAQQLVLPGERISAEEALRIGLVNQVVEAGELRATAEAIAKKIIANAPLAVKFSMEAIDRGLELPQEEGLYLEATLFGLLCATEDMREGTRAFLEKRAAQFKTR